MLSGRELINEIEQMLSDLDADEVRNQFLQYTATLVKITLFHSNCSISYNMLFCIDFSGIKLF
jgi:hypothetical protein